MYNLQVTMYKKLKKIIHSTLYILHSSRGFTLIEMLVVIAIIAIIGTMSTQIILSIIKSNNKTNIQNEVRQNGSYVIDSLERDIRSAISITNPVPLVSPGANGTTLTLVNSDGTNTTYTCGNKAAGSNGFFRRNGNDLLNGDLSSGVAVDNTAGKQCNFNVVNSNPLLVTVTFTLTQAINSPNRSDLSVSQSFETTVTLRTYN